MVPKSEYDTVEENYSYIKKLQGFVGDSLLEIIADMERSVVFDTADSKQDPRENCLVRLKNLVSVLNFEKSIDDYKAALIVTSPDDLESNRLLKLSNL